MTIIEATNVANVNAPIVLHCLVVGEFLLDHWSITLVFVTEEILVELVEEAIRVIIEVLRVAFYVDESSDFLRRLQRPLAFGAFRSHFFPF